MESIVRDAQSVTRSDREGHFMEEYRSAGEAAEAIGTTPSAVYQNCHGNTLLTKGCIFLFINGDVEEELEERLRKINEPKPPKPSKRKSYLNPHATTNLLSDKYPAIAAQWHPTKNGNLTPDAVSAGNGKVVWWIDEFGHEWQSSICNRTSQSLGCPYCGNQKLLTGFNDLETRFPEIAKEWLQEKNGDLRPNQVLYGSSKKAWWKCSKCGHEWETKINSRTKGYGCPVCGRKRALESRKAARAGVSSQNEGGTDAPGKL